MLHDRNGAGCTSLCAGAASVAVDSPQWDNAQRDPDGMAGPRVYLDKAPHPISRIQALERPLPRRLRPQQLSLKILLAPARGLRLVLLPLTFAFGSPADESGNSE